MKLALCKHRWIFLAATGSPPPTLALQTILWMKYVKRHLNFHSSTFHPLRSLCWNADFEGNFMSQVWQLDAKIFCNHTVLIYYSYDKFQLFGWPWSTIIIWKYSFELLVSGEKSKLISLHIFLLNRTMKVPNFNQSICNILCKHKNAESRKLGGQIGLMRVTIIQNNESCSDTLLCAVLVSPSQNQQKSKECRKGQLKRSKGGTSFLWGKAKVFGAC